MNTFSSTTTQNPNIFARVLESPPVKPKHIVDWITKCQTPGAQQISINATLNGVQLEMAGCQYLSGHDELHHVEKRLTNLIDDKYHDGKVAFFGYEIATLALLFITMVMSFIFCWKLYCMIKNTKIMIMAHLIHTNPKYATIYKASSSAIDAVVSNNIREANHHHKTKELVADVLHEMKMKTVAPEPLSRNYP